jgi:hypothetical protein
MKIIYLLFISRYGSLSDEMFLINYLFGVGKITTRFELRIAKMRLTFFGAVLLDSKGGDYVFRCNLTVG